MKSPIRIALAGAGGIVQVVHKPSILSQPEKLCAVGVSDPHMPAAESLATEFGAKAYQDYTAMLDDLGDAVDAVLITTPHDLHFAQAAEALRRGLPVLVEKPAVCNLQEYRTLAQIEAKGGAFLQAGQQQRFGLVENHLKEWLQGSAFGEPRLFNLDIYQNIESYVASKADPWLTDKNRAGGGVVLSVAIHPLDLLRYWMNSDFTEVYARGRFDPPMRNGAESTVTATLVMSNGVLGTLNATYTAKRCPYSQRTLLFGSGGSLYQHVDKPGGGYAGTYYLNDDGGEPTTESTPVYSGWQSVAEVFGDSVGQDDLVAPFARQIAHFAECVDEKRAGENSLRRNANSIAVVDALYRSLDSGKPEMVEDL